MSIFITTVIESYRLKILFFFRTTNNLIIGQVTKEYKRSPAAILLLLQLRQSIFFSTLGVCHQEEHLVGIWSLHTLINIVSLAQLMVFIHLTMFVICIGITPSGLASYPFQYSPVYLFQLSQSSMCSCINMRFCSICHDQSYYSFIHFQFRISC